MSNEKLHTETQNAKPITETEQAIAQPLEWAELWAAMKQKPHPWVLTSNAMYWNMLECLPPRAMAGDGFLVGEADSDNEQREMVYACFMQRGNVTKARYLTVREFHANTYPAF